MVEVDGSYSATLEPAQTNGQPLIVTQSDAAGNGSLPTALTAPDLDAPAVPDARVAVDGTSVVGIGEPRPSSTCVTHKEILSKAI